jgi:hypothetical protein
MKHIFLLIFCTVLVTSCYRAPEIVDFNKDDWEMALDNCNSYRIESTEKQLLLQEENILGASQNEIKALLGNPTRHQLFNRNQKFFYYQLNCEKDLELSIRFDALGRVKEIQMIKVQK